MAISYTKLGRGVFPSTATLDSQTPPLNDTKIPLSDEPPLFLDCSQQPTFVAPQAALCQPANLQSQFKDCFKMGSLIGRGSSESFQPAFQGPDSVAIQPRESRLVVSLS